MLLVRAIARLIEILWMAVIALVGIGVGLYCLDGLISLGSARPDRLLHLPVVRRHVGQFLAQLSAPGSVAILALVCGVAAIVIGLALVVGLLGSRRERLIVVERDAERGDLYARTRTVTRMIRSVTEQTPGVTGVHRSKLRLKRSGERGKLKLLASRGPRSDAAAVDDAVHERVDPITEPLHLSADVRVRLLEPKEREERVR